MNDRIKSIQGIIMPLTLNTSPSVNSAQAIAAIEDILTIYIKSSENNKSRTWFHQANNELSKFRVFCQTEKRDVYAIQAYVLEKLAPTFTTIGNRLFGQSGSSLLRLQLERIAENWTKTDTAFLEELQNMLGPDNSENNGEAIQIMDSIFFDSLTSYTPQNNTPTRNLSSSEDIPQEMYKTALCDPLSTSQEEETQKLQKAHIFYK